MKEFQRIFLACVLIAALIYGWAHKGLFLSLRNVSMVHISALILLTFLSELQNGYKFRLLMKIFDTDLDFKAWYGLSMCNAMLNYCLPARGGLAARAYYLKRRYQFGYSHYAALVAGSCAIGLPVSAGTGFLAVVLSAAIGRAFYWTLAVIFGSLLALTGLGVPALLVLREPATRNRETRLAEILRRGIEGLSLFGANKRLVVWHSILQATGILIWAARLLVAFSAIGVPVVFTDMVMTSSLGTFAIVLPLTPASLGVSEGIVTASAHSFGIAVDTALLAALVDRAVATAMTLALGLLFTRILLADLRVSEGGS